MYEKQSKKLLILNILDILRRYSDAEHTLSQKDIEDILNREYSMRADRKSVRRNLMELLDFGYQIEYSEKIRNTPVKDKDGNVTMNENVILSDFYLVREFSDAELRLLIDSILFSRHIPYNQCKELVGKLEGLSNKHFKARIKHIARMPADKTRNMDIFLNIELLDEAISKKKKVSFKYLEYATDKKLHIKLDSTGKEREYIINPYQMAAKEGKYYLICNLDKYNQISNYRIDRIKDLKILDEPVKNFKTLKNSDGMELNLEKYMKEHIYMYSSDNSRVKFRITKPMVTDVIDMFGTDVRFMDEDEEHVTVSVVANEMAIIQFAKSFLPAVVLLEPPHLVEWIKADLEEVMKMY